MNNKSLNYDILKELFNISVGKAASLLSEIINRKIKLSVPNIEILNFNSDELSLEQYLPKVIDGALMISSISFEEKLKGRANLVFPAEKMRTFINLCINENENDEAYGINFTDVDFDIIKEIGNIVLNCIVGEVGNYLDMHLDYTLPQVRIFSSSDFGNDLKNNGYRHILILQISFIIDGEEIEGAILVDLTLNSLNELMKKIDSIEETLYE